MALMSSLCGAVFTELTEAAIQGNDYSPEKGAEDLSVALVTGLMGMGLGSVTDKMAKGLAATESMTAFNALLKERFGDSFARFAADAGKSALTSAFSTFPKSYASDAIRTEGLLRQELLGVKGALSTTVKSYAVGLVTKAISYSVNDRTAQLEELKSAGVWDEYADVLLQKKLVDLAIVTAVTKLNAGTPLTAKDWVSLVCKVATTRNGAALSAKSAQEDASKSLQFFNTASKEELKKVKGIGDGVADRIIAARQSAGTSGFQQLQNVYEVPYFKEEVLMPASKEIRNDFLAQKAAAAAAGSAPS